MVPPGMAGNNPDAVELGRRVRVARTYTGVSQIELADLIGIDPATLGRWEKGEVSEGYKRDALLDAAMQAAKLPEEFFTIDFNDLPLMVRSWHQAQRLARPEDLARIVDDVLARDPRPG
jgi:transcriptional regulator with XRE-family HTH domain